MNHKKYLYSSGEFAKFTGINKRTLHYYNEIGLFCPEVIGENGYHYYTCFQFAQLELILTLRKIGLSLDEIREYVTTPSDESFSQMMIKKKKLIDESINQLLSVQSFLEQKAERLKIGMQSKHGKIERCTLPERKLVLSAPISGDYDEEDFSVAAEFSLRLKTLFHLYDNFGSQSRWNRLKKIVFTVTILFRLLPTWFKDIYVVSFRWKLSEKVYCIGRWSSFRPFTNPFFSYARAHQLTLTGYAYEED